MSFSGKVNDILAMLPISAINLLHSTVGAVLCNAMRCVAPATQPAALHQQLVFTQY